MLVLGIDPGTAATGYGVVRGGGAAVPVLVECGVIRTRPRDPLATRLRQIFEGIQELIVRHAPDALSVEDVFYAKNVRTTVVLGHARGVILLAAELAAKPVNELTPTEIKKSIVGTGSASKEQVQFMLTRLLRLKSAPQPSDAADGVAAALACVMGASLPRIDDGSRVREPSRPALSSPSIVRRS